MENVMPEKVEGWSLDSEEFLSALASEAAKQAEGLPNLYWKRAYLALSDAADRLHAMTMRTMVKE